MFPYFTSCSLQSYSFLNSACFLVFFLVLPLQIICLCHGVSSYNPCHCSLLFSAPPLINYLGIRDVSGVPVSRVSIILFIHPSFFAKRSPTLHFFRFQTGLLFFLRFIFLSLSSVLPISWHPSIPVSHLLLPPIWIKAANRIFE